MKKSFSAIGSQAFFISAATGEGTLELMAKAVSRLQSVPKPEAGQRKKIFRP
jgi:hypothetical protein